MKLKMNKQSGYVALISLIIIGAIVLIAVMGLTFMSLSQKKNIISQNKTVKNFYLANACANYAILQLQKDSDYQGNESVDLDGLSCKIESVSGSGNYDRTIITSSKNGDQLKKIKIEIDQLKPKTIIKTWGETFE